MPLTLEQIDSEIMRASNLTDEAVDLDGLAHKTFLSMLFFLVLGIFFFPCLVIALICFALYYWGKNRSKELWAEIHRVEAVPEIKERIETLIAEQNSKSA